jgi:hypothetical protein
MCLDRLAKFTVDENARGEAWAWKVFVVRPDGNECLPCLSCTKKIDYDKWLNERTYRDISFIAGLDGMYSVGMTGKEHDGYYLSSAWRLYTEKADKEYRAGFHCFLSQRDAAWWGRRLGCTNGFKSIIRRILTRRIVAQGIEKGRRVIVAKEIYISSEHDLNKEAHNV